MAEEKVSVPADVKQQENAQVAAVDNSDNNMLVFGSKGNFETAQRMASLLASSTIVPTQYQKNMPNCMVALEMANRMGASPLMVMQNLYIVHGNPSWSSKFLVAALNACGRFSPLRYKEFGDKGKDNWGCYACAIDLATGEELQGPEVTIDMAKKEGWYGKSGSKWQTIPQLMLHYRAAAFFQRTYAPEISMGLMTQEENIDVYGADQSQTPTRKRMTGAEMFGKINEVQAEVEEAQAVEVESPETLFP